MNPGATFGWNEMNDILTYSQTSDHMTHGDGIASIKSGLNYGAMHKLNHKQTFHISLLLCFTKWSRCHGKHYWPPLWRLTDSGLQRWQEVWTLWWVARRGETRHTKMVEWRRGGGQGCVCASRVINKWMDKRRSGEREFAQKDKWKVRGGGYRGQ